MSEIETKKANKHRAELVKAIRREANRITVNKSSAEVDKSIKTIQKAIKTYQSEERRLIVELWVEHYNRRKWRPFF